MSQGSPDSNDHTGTQPKYFPTVDFSMKVSANNLFLSAGSPANIE